MQSSELGVLKTSQVSKLDSIVWLATFLGCTMVSIDAGLGLGVSLGLLFLFIRLAFPRIGRLRAIPGTDTYRDASLYNLQARPY